MEFIDYGFFTRELKKIRECFSQKQHVKIKLPKIKPLWMNSDEPLNRIYTEFPILIETGSIHYACLVQANEILFKSFPRVDFPAAILFSTNDAYDDEPGEMLKLASELYTYKGTDDAPETIKRIVDVITDEHERLLNVKLPINSANRQIYYTTIMVFRRHLPRGLLSGQIFPVITAPDNAKSTMILPYQFWSKAFVDFFNDL